MSIFTTADVKSLTAANVELVVDTTGKMVALTVGRETVLLTKGEWSLLIAKPQVK